MAEVKEWTKEQKDKWVETPTAPPKKEPFKIVRNVDKSYWAKTLKTKNANDPSTKSKPSR